MDTSTEVMLLDIFFLQVSVHIFDTSGASLFTDVRTEFYREAHGLLMVMDVTKRESFESLSDWVLEVKQEVGVVVCDVVLLLKSGCLVDQRGPRTGQHSLLPGRQQVRRRQ